ncbi:hypothetical protein G6F57_001862 [Rhizopus arrhizus]|nr:hypothetical protein G6F30_002901 [Rhizopus arrhizus]KAG1422352.1 hypothetical protein G6F58_003350 [Rhizopus delemar]KAG0989834.1 hypothetical protein G6F29_000676 [Rhizopus arrhizus]KAG0997991.1 hypothetical protein G6F28_002367 [Rhizopus arrhizus]KAG1012027.1 hypothetical protein G6F27_003198 [Rhizopus arrhizus]
MDEEEEADSEEETEPVVDQLYKLYFKKFNKQEFDDEENTFLKQMVKKKSCIKDKVLGLASKLLLKKNTDVQDDMMLKLSLSSIVNIIQPDSYDILKKVFTKKEMEAIEKINLDLYVGLSEEDEKLLKKVVESGGAEGNTDNMMDEILTEQLRLSKLRLYHSDTYKIENVDNYSEADSEMTAYRLCAKILDCLFSGTGLRLLDGEPGCIAIKEEIIVSHSLFPISEKNALSTRSVRKIDAIVIAEMQKEKVELSSMEEEMVQEDLFLAREPLRDGGTNRTVTPTAHTKTIHITIPITTPSTTNNFHGKLQHSDRWNSTGGGRLQRFLYQWQSMTRRPWPLPVVQEGYQIPLIRKPTPWKLRQIKLNQTEQSAVDKAVEKFLQAVERLPTYEEMTKNISPMPITFNQLMGLTNHEDGQYFRLLLTIAARMEKHVPCYTLGVYTLSEALQIMKSGLKEEIRKQQLLIVNKRKAELN